MIIIASNMPSIAPDNLLCTFISISCPDQKSPKKCDNFVNPTHPTIPLN